MNNANQRPGSHPQPSASITVADVYYVLFRRKWLILFFALLGIGGAAGAWFLTPAEYASEARLLVRYVLETKSMDTLGAAASDFKSPDTRGDNVLNSEIDIITSQDLADKVVESVGASKILAAYGGGTNRVQAAFLVRSKIEAEVPRKSNVMRVGFSHRDQEMAIQVLRSLVDAYLKKHVEIHRPLSTFDDFLTQQTDRLRSSLNQTEEQLRDLKSKAGVISVEEAQRAVNQQLMSLKNTLNESEATLAQEKATLELYERVFPNAIPARLSTNQEPGAGSGTNVLASGTNAPASGTNLLAAATNALARGTNILAASTNTQAVTNAVAAAPPKNKINDYKNLCARLEATRKRETDLTMHFTDEHPMVKSTREQIAQAEKEKEAMEKEFPQLADMGTAITAGPTEQRSQIDPLAQKAKVAALEAKIKVLNQQYIRLRAEATNVDSVATAILQLQRKRDLDETNFVYFSRSLEQARTDEALGAGKTSNIGRAQEPTPPVRSMKKLQKICLAILAGGIGGGLALAFALEMFLGQTVRLPKDIETGLHLPLLMTIPQFSRSDMKIPVNRQLPAPREGAGSEPAQGPPQPPAVPPELLPYVEALRDRLGVHLEGVNHKPKLVAIAGAARGAGASTIAAGLAASLSETGEGKVLLVDLNLEQGAAHPFLHGRPAISLADAADTPPPNGGDGQPNLLLATISTSDKSKSVLLPKRFAQLVPKLVASDYDYIIFDMPPVTSTSVTPRLARLMDATLLVVESEKTQRDLVKQADKLLKAHKAEVAVVLNKRRTYVPSNIVQEI